MDDAHLAHAVSGANDSCFGVLDGDDDDDTVATLPEATAWLNEKALVPFIDEVRAERLAEVERIGEHVELSLTEVLQRIE